MAFWKPGAERPASALDRASVREQELGIDVPQPSFVDAELRERLPVYRHRRELLYLLEHHGVVVVVGHTGSGKTTRTCAHLTQKFRSTYARQGGLQTDAKWFARSRGASRPRRSLRASPRRRAPSSARRSGMRCASRTARTRCTRNSSILRRDCCSASACAILSCRATAS